MVLNPPLDSRRYQKSPFTRSLKSRSEHLVLSVTLHLVHGYRYDDLEGLGLKAELVGSVSSCIPT